MQKKNERQVDAGGEFGGFWKYLLLVWQQAELNISRERSFYLRWKSNSLLAPESWEDFIHTDESKGTALGLDRAWNYTSPLQAAMLFRYQMAKKNEVNRWKCFLTLQVLWWYILWGLEWHFRRLCLGFQWSTSTGEPSYRINTDVGVRSSTPLMMTYECSGCSGEAWARFPSYPWSLLWFPLSHLLCRPLLSAASPPPPPTPSPLRSERVIRYVIWIPSSISPRVRPSKPKSQGSCIIWDFCFCLFILFNSISIKGTFIKIPTLKKDHPAFKRSQSVSVINVYRFVKPISSHLRPLRALKIYLHRQEKCLICRLLQDPVGFISLFKDT